MNLEVVPEVDPEIDTRFSHPVNQTLPPLHSRTYPELLKINSVQIDCCPCNQVRWRKQYIYSIWGGTEFRHSRLFNSVSWAPRSLATLREIGKGLIWVLSAGLEWSPTQTSNLDWQLLPLVTCLLSCPLGDTMIAWFIQLHVTKGAGWMKPENKECCLNKCKLFKLKQQFPRYKNLNLKSKHYPS